MAGTMRSKALKTFEAETPAQWRRWLAAHHDSETAVWLVFHKRHTGRRSIAYNDAVDEALCFGWVDSLIKRLDDDRYARKFTPRKPESRWSEANRKRYAALRASGRLEPAGLARPPTDRTYDMSALSLSTVPGYIRDALDGQPKARKFFDSLAPSYRRMYVAWIDSAKKQETKIRRLEEAIGLLSAGKKLGLK